MMKAYSLGSGAAPTLGQRTLPCGSVGLLQPSPKAVTELHSGVPLLFVLATTLQGGLGNMGTEQTRSTKCYSHETLEDVYLVGFIN